MRRRLARAGLVVIAGTGSICLGKNEAGKIAISGGWGPLAGDEGGGVGIARMRFTPSPKRLTDAAMPTELSEHARSEYFRASGPENLIVAIYSPQIDNTRIAGFARLVVETALDGDKIAVHILEDAGRELGIAAAAVISKLDLQNDKVPIGCVGSIFNAGTILTRPMLATVKKTAPKAFLTEPRMAPAHAAALMALRTLSNGKNGNWPADLAPHIRGIAIASFSFAQQICSYLVHSRRDAHIWRQKWKAEQNFLVTRSTRS